MRCHICNAILSPSEVQYNTNHQDWDPCGRCQEEIDSVFNDKSEEEIDGELELELGLFEIEERESPDETSEPET